MKLTSEKIIHKITKIIKVPPAYLVLRALGAFVFTAGALRLLVRAPVTDLNAYAQISVWFGLAVFVAVFAAVTLLTYAKRGKNADRYFLPAAMVPFSLIAAVDFEDVWPVLMLGALWAVLCFYYARQGWLRLPLPLKFGRGGAIAAVIFAAGAFLLTVGAYGVLRYRNFHSPNFDFGIFCNLFYHMRETGVPLTTCERDIPLSHFAVHISPVLYLLWPVYALFPKPETLQLMQAALLASAAVPAYLLARHYAHSRAVASVFAFLAVLHPAVGGGTSYDFHENCFLLPFLLWAFYFAEKKKYVPFALFCILTLSVKEDAFVYIAFLALWMIAERRRYIAGGITAVLGLAWFLIALKLLTAYGTGVMTGRYGHYIVNGGGLMEAVKNVLRDPAYVLTQLFADKNGSAMEKAAYALQMLAPLAFLPLCIKRPARLLLLGPMVLVNMMTVYAYQYAVGYQYSFGSFAVLLFLAEMNAAEIEKRSVVKGALCSALCVAVLCFTASTGDQVLKLVKEADQNAAQFAVMETALAQIPEEASVCCSTSLLPHLANRDVIYEDYYHKPAPGEKLDYVIVDYTHGHEEEVAKYRALGYEVTQEVKLGERVLIAIMQFEPIADSR